MEVKATIKTDVGELVIEGTEEEFEALLRALLFPKLRSSEKKIQETLIRLPLWLPFQDYRKHFRSKGEVKNPNQRPREYIYYKRVRDNSYIVRIVNHEGAEKAKLKLGSLNDPESKIGKVVSTLKRWPRQTFTSREFFSQVQNSWWRNRWSRMKCAIDILLKEGFIQRVSDPPSVPVIYRIVRRPLVDGSEASQKPHGPLT